MKVLIAVDGSKYTRRVLAYLTAHDEWLGPQHAYTVVHAVPQVPGRAAVVLDKETLSEHYKSEAERVFKPIATFLDKQGVHADYVYKVGHAHEVIGKLAEKGKFELLVMGSHGHTTIGNLIMGSVASKVLASCKTPVLLVR